jgi:putative phage-type endonuclease
MTVERLPIPAGMRLHPLRSTVLTASDVAAAAGVDPYKTRLDLWLEKAGLRPPQAETPLMRRGRHFEAAAIEYLKEEYGYTMLRPNVFLIDRANRMGASPDLLLEDPDEPGDLINCQIKTMAKRVFDGLDGPTIGHQLQCTQEAMLLGAKYSILAVLVVGEFSAELECFPIARHPDAEAKIREIARTFWRSIETGEQPQADYTRDGEILRELYPPKLPADPPLDLTSDNRILTLLEEWERQKAVRKGAEAAADALKDELVEKLAGHTHAIAPGWKITRKMVHRNEHVVAAVDYPDTRAVRVVEKEKAA